MKVMSMPSGLDVFKCDYTTVLLNSPIICVKKFSITAETLEQAVIKIPGL